MDTKRRTIDQETPIREFIIPYPNWQWLFFSFIENLAFFFVCGFLGQYLFYIEFSFWGLLFVCLCFILLPTAQNPFNCINKVAFYDERVELDIRFLLKYKRKISYDNLKISRGRFLGEHISFTNSRESYFNDFFISQRQGWSLKKQQEILDFLSTFQDGRFKPNPK